MRHRDSPWSALFAKGGWLKHGLLFKRNKFQVSWPREVIAEEFDTIGK
jgi:hypothetical protein